MTIEHLCKDSARAFKAWYQGLKDKPLISRDKQTFDFSVEGNVYKLGKIKAITLSDKLSPDEYQKLKSDLDTIAAIRSRGLEPAIIPVKDNEEANELLKLKKEL